MTVADDYATLCKEETGADAAILILLFNEGKRTRCDVGGLANTAETRRFIVALREAADRLELSLLPGATPGSN
jgi:hypothetical protein